MQATVSYNLFGSQADAQFARARLQKTQSQARLRALELQVATEVTNAALSVQSNLKRVEAAVAARELAEKRLEAEQSKFEVGMTTNFFVVQAQRDLRDAQNTELRALADYRKSLVVFERVQEAPGGGGGGGLSATTGGRRSVVLLRDFYAQIAHRGDRGRGRSRDLFRLHQARHRRLPPNRVRTLKQVSAVKAVGRGGNPGGGPGGGGFGGGGFGGPGGGGGFRPPMTVEVAKVQRGKISSFLTVVGNLVGDQHGRSRAANRRPGHVDQRQARRSRAP